MVTGGMYKYILNLFHASHNHINMLIIKDHVLKVMPIICIYITYVHSYVHIYAKQKHLRYKKVRDQSEATCKQAGATKSFDIS